MKDFKKLKVWEKAHALTLQVYKATAGFPSDEKYGLTSQIRRAASSVPTNIAEGCGKGSDPDFARFLQMAMGSTCEVEYHLILAGDLGYLNGKEYLKLNGDIEEIKRMLATLIGKVRSSNKKADS